MDFPLFVGGMGSGFLSLSCTYVLSGSWLCKLLSYMRACSFITAVDVHVVEGVSVPFLCSNWKLKLLLICNWVCSKPCSELRLLIKSSFPGQSHAWGFAMRRRWSKLCMFLQNAGCMSARMHPPTTGGSMHFWCQCWRWVLYLGRYPNGTLCPSSVPHLGWTHALQPQDAQIQFNTLVNEFTSMQTLSIFHVHVSKPSAEGLATNLPQVCSRPCAKSTQMSSLSGLNVLLQAHWDVPSQACECSEGGSCS